MNYMDSNKIKEVNWYRQQTGAVPYFAYRPSCGCVAGFKQPEHIYWFCNQEEARGYLDKDVMGKMAAEYLAKEKKEPGNLTKMFAEWTRSIGEVNQKIYDEIDAHGLHTMSDQELLVVNRKLVEQSFVMWTKFFMDIYDADAEGLIEKELVNAGVVLTPEEKGEMLAHPKPLAFQRENRDLLRIAKLVKSMSNASSAFLYITNPSNLHRLKLYPEIESALAEHQKAYFWIRNSWAVTSVVSIFDFVEMVKQMIFSARDVESEYQDLVAYEENAKVKKKKIADKYKMSDWLRQVFDFFGLLSFWRDERKVEVQRMNHYLELLGREIGKRSNLDWHEIQVCDPLLIKGIPVSRELVDGCKEFFNKRFMIGWDGKQATNLSAEESKLLVEAIEHSIEAEVTEIRGMIACPGKVEGEVVIINGEKDFHKMKKGLILVAPMTRPEYTPLMKVASAIVTDEGGITSHAAIVSRELKIPCIIGTQVATKKLKDGDRVLVNANHGVVVVRE